MNRSKRCELWHVGLVAGCLLLMLPSLVSAEGSIEIPTMISGGAGASQSRTVAEDLDLEIRDNKMELGLEQAIGLALRHNLSLVVQRYARSQSIFGIQQNEGIYDYLLTAFGSVTEDTTPTTSALQQTGGAALTQEQQRLNIELRGLVSSGGTFQIDFNNNRTVTSNLNDTLNPSFGLDFDLTFTQPILRNFGREVTERNLIVSRTNAAISKEDFQTQVETIIQQASDTYWALVESREQLDVAEESLALAERLHRMNEIQVEVGTLAPLEVVTSDARVAARRQDIIRFRAQVEDNADALRQLFNLDRGQLWDVEIVPTTNPAVDHETIDVEEAFQQALKSRPDVRRRKLQNDTLDLDARVARNQTRPQLDLAATYGSNAAEGDAFEQVRDSETGETFLVPIGSTDYIDGIETIAGFDFDGWQVSATFSYPLQNRDAKARKAIADLAAEQGQYQLRDLELQVLTDVRVAARGVETAAEQIESAKVSSQLQERNLEAQQKRYENGLSTSFQVLEIQEDLSEARSAEVSAIISYRRAKTSFYRSVGQLLDHFNVTLSDDESE